MDAGAGDDWVRRVLGVEPLEPEAASASALPKDPAAIGTLAAIRLKLRAVQGARDAASVALAAACRTMMRTDAFTGPDAPDDPALDAAVAAIGTRVPAFAPFSGSIDAALAQMERTADPARRARAAGSARAAIGQFRAAVQSEAILREMESTDAGEFAIQSPLLKALNELDRALG